MQLTRQCTQPLQNPERLIQSKYLRVVLCGNECERVTRCLHFHALAGITSIPRTKAPSSAAGFSTGLISAVARGVTRRLTGK